MYVRGMCSTPDRYTARQHSVNIAVADIALRQRASGVRVALNLWAEWLHMVVGVWGIGSRRVSGRRWAW